MIRLAFTRAGSYDYASPSMDNQDEEIYTLFLNDSSLTVRLQKMVGTLDSGYYYKTFFYYNYNVKTNAHGEKFLSVYRKTDKGLCFSNGFQEIGDNQFLYKNSQSDIFNARGSKFCEEMVKAIEDHLTLLLGFDFKYAVLPTRSDDDWYEGGEVAFYNTPEALCFPFLRDKANRDFVSSLLKEDHARLSESLMNTLIKLEGNGTRGLTEALRNSKTKSDLIRSLVYKSALKTDEDIAFLIENPTFLRVFSTFDMKMGAKEATAQGYAKILNNAHHYMTVPEVLTFQFLLRNLPKDQTAEVLTLITHLANFRASQQINGVVENLPHMVDQQIKEHFSIQHTWRKQLFWYFRTLPVADRKGFAVRFLKEFKAEYAKTEEQYALRINLPSDVYNRSECFTNVMDAYIRTYSDKYIKTSPADSLDRCVSAAMELFGVDLSEDRSLASDSIAVKELDTTLNYYDFSNQVFKRLHRDDRKNFFYMIRMDVEAYAIWSHKLFNPANIIFADYVNTYSPIDFILASDLEKMLRKIAAKIDAGLVKVGQPVSPENRMIYLEANAHARKFKTNWRYYHLGVSVDEVPLYKKAGFKSKKDITFWLETKASLPSEVYSELLKTAAGYDVQEAMSSLSF